MPNYYVASDLLERPGSGLLYERGDVQSDTAWTSEYGSGGFTRLQTNGAVIVDTHILATTVAGAKTWRDAAKAKIVKGQS